MLIFNKLFKFIKMPKANTKNKRKPNYIVTSNTTAIRQIKIKIDSFITNELALKVVARHKTFRAKTKSLFFTWVWGKLQSGKTTTIDKICQKLKEEFINDADAAVTTTLSDKMLNEQLKIGRAHV